MSDLTINKFLQETQLTSTKNKYLILNEKLLAYRTGFQNVNCEDKDLFTSNCFLNQSRNLLTSTENKFIPSNLLLDSPEPNIKAFKRKKKQFPPKEVNGLDQNTHVLKIESDYVDHATESGLFESVYVDHATERGLFGHINLQDCPKIDFMALSMQPMPPLGLSDTSATNAFCFGSGSQPRMHFMKPAPLDTSTFSFTSAVEISEMPSYEFQTQATSQAAKNKLDDFCSLQDDTLQLEKVENNRRIKMQFIHVSSMALICVPKLKDISDPYRIFLLECADDVRAINPEFILKVALYCRQELHIRSVSNFLLSYAAYHESTRPFLSKYYDACIRLPSDWMEVAELFKVFGGGKRKLNSLPSALKKVMAKSFAKFDQYQLAKYNKEKVKNQKGHSKDKYCKSDLEDSWEDDCSATFKYTLKYLVRLLHLKSPAYEVMCILGKKYPESAEDFKQSGLQGIWNSNDAGKRMKLPIPDTWETQLPLFGNNAAVWEHLIDSSKLPYMAMLRNIKNLVLSGISKMHHDKVLNYLQNKAAVLKSRQLPLQFFEAFNTLVHMESLSVDYGLSSENVIDTTPPWKKKNLEKLFARMKDVSNSLLAHYKTAVSKALEISSLYNLPPIPGQSLVICDILPNVTPSPQQKKVRQLCIMVGLMCLRACEDCNMNIICGEKVVTVENNENTFLDTVMDLCSKIEHQDEVSKPSPIESFLNEFLQIWEVFKSSSIIALKQVLEFYLKHLVMKRKKLDHIIFLRASDRETKETSEVMTSFLYKYRQLVNPDLLYTDINFLQSNYRFEDSGNTDGKDVYLSGNTTQLVKFIAERSSGGQLASVESIDDRYNLPKMSNLSGKSKNNLSPQDKMPFYSKIPKWHTIRIFISSTFKDMHSERDLLNRYVIPELKRRASSIFIKINEVDLRWGITETACESNRAFDLCLLEAQKSDILIGILGDRYGTVYNFECLESPDLHWLKSYPKGLSITELEIHAGGLHKLAEKAPGKNAFFYFRDDSFFSSVPEKWKSHFASESSESKQKLEELKTKIRSSGFSVFEKYPSQWAGVLGDKPILGGLDAFGKRVLSDLWEEIMKIHEKDPFEDDLIEEDNYHNKLIDTLNHCVETKSFPTETFIKMLQKECGLFVISGSPGSGKTSLIVNLLPNLEAFTVVKYFIGITPRSTDLSHMLNYFTNIFASHFPVTSLFSKLANDVTNNFPDILHEAVLASGNDLILVIDGLDHFPDEAQTLDWLPHTLPEGLRIICSVSDNSTAYKILQEKQYTGKSIFIENLLPISQNERERMVRNYLKLYGKTLDESPFNNQLMQLVTKKDSSIPLYLRIACDYLRSYASFDTFMLTLQRLPSTLPLLLEETILQMENEFGSVTVQTALTLLSISKEGIDEADLHTLLSIALSSKTDLASSEFKAYLMQIKKFEFGDLLSQVTYCSLVHIICTFVYGHNRFQKFNLAKSVFKKAVKKFYVNKGLASFKRNMHCYLAAHFYSLCDPVMDETWKGYEASAFRSLMHHLYKGKCYNELINLLCCQNFLESSFRVQAENSVLKYYSLILNANKRKFDGMQKLDFNLLSSYNNFISRNLHILQMYPSLIVQQALNEQSDTLVKSTLKEDFQYPSHILESLGTISDHRIATLKGFVKKITAVSCINTSNVILGNENGYLKVLDISTKKVTRNMKSHSSAITYICFLGKNRICTASTDTTLRIWSAVDYSQIAVLQGHRNIVSCCCADSSSNTLFSCGWDNSVRIWSLRDGRLVSTIDDFKCPINCIDHHPLKQQIACGLWSGSVEILDTISLEKILVLPNTSSVKAVAYNPDGINILSSYINADVTIWSSEQGLQISNLKGHILPVKSLSYLYAFNMLLSGSEDCTLKVWPAESGLSFCTISECNFCPISLMEFVSSNFLAVAFLNCEIWIIDINNGDIISKRKLQSDLITCFSTKTDTSSINDDTAENWTDDSFVFGTKTGTIKVGKTLTSSITSVICLNSKITSCVHMKAIIMCATSDGDIGVISYPQINSRIITSAHKGFITSLSMHSVDELIWSVSAASDNVLKFWTIDPKEIDIILNKTCLSKHSDYLSSCHLFSQETCQNCLLTGSHDNNIVLQYGETNTIFRGLKTCVIHVNFMNDFVLGCGIDGSVAVWEKSGKLLSFVSGVDQSSVILSFYVDKDASHYGFDASLAYADKDGSVKINKPLRRSHLYSLEGHSKGITSCCASETGEIVSCSHDGTVNLWRMPLNPKRVNLSHSNAITDAIVSASNNIAVTSDDHGTIILWKMSWSLNSSDHTPLTYSATKSYTGGFVKALSWLKNKKFACAVTQVVDNREKYFLEIISFLSNDPLECNTFSLKVIVSHKFESELMCIDSNEECETLVAGFKSGSFVIIKNQEVHTLHIYPDLRCAEWILDIKLFQTEDLTEYIFLMLVNGSVHRFKTSEVLTFRDLKPVPLDEFQFSESIDKDVFICCVHCFDEKNIICGDTQGWIRLYSENLLSVCKKVHDDTITGISVIEKNYIFTSSLDKTLKGWKLSIDDASESLFKSEAILQGLDGIIEQICFYQSLSPITCLKKWNIPDSSHDLNFVIGTCSGALQVLKFHHPLSVR